uniref:Uncharacterized protein n=1 Tax=Kalanchoe fedtschenkoi TaxID=63787 RepID=A0A7N0UTG7_KALFE
MCTFCVKTSVNRNDGREGSNCYNGSEMQANTVSCSGNSVHSAPLTGQITSCAPNRFSDNSALLTGHKENCSKMI